MCCLGLLYFRTNLPGAYWIEMWSKLNQVFEFKSLYVHVGLSLRDSRSCNHGNESIKPIHEQQLCGSGHFSSLLCPHPLWVCLLPLQAQVSYSLIGNPSEKADQQQSRIQNSCLSSVSVNTLPKGAGCDTWACFSENMF